MDENLCVNIILNKSKLFIISDIYSVKSWLLVGKTLFPKNFNIQYELYLMEKETDNISEIVLLLNNLYINFSNEPILRKELQNITSSLLNEDADETSLKYKKIFELLASSIQCQLLFEKVELNVNDPVNQCRMLKLLLEKHQDYLPARIQLANIIKHNLLAEKHENFQKVTNGICHIIVSDALPFLLECPQLYNINENEFLHLLYLTFEFFVHHIFHKTESDKITWPHLFSIIKLFGVQLRWLNSDSIDSAKSMEEKLDYLEEVYTYLSANKNDSSESLKQKLLFFIAAIYFESLYHYMLSLGFNIITKQQSSFLLEFSSNDNLILDNKSKRMKLVSDDLLLLKSNNNFLLSLKCRRMLKSYILIKDYEKLILSFTSKHIFTVIKNFEIDALIYDGLYKEALHDVKFSSLSYGNFSNIKYLLQKSYCSHKLKNYKESIECIYECLQTDSLQLGPISDELKISLHDKRRVLKFVEANSNDLFAFCIRMILISLQKRIAGLGVPTSDTVLGHMIVLLQYDWPVNADLFEEVLRIIKQNHSFCYPGFMDYVINMEIIEEFAFLRNLGMFKLELCCAGVKNQNCRSMAKLLNKQGCKENLKLILEKQISRTDENLFNLLKDFLIREKDSIRQCCEN